MRAGRAIRYEKALKHAFEQPCDKCGHPTGAHYELPYGSPGYKPLVFHCKETGCDCARTEQA